MLPFTKITFVLCLFQANPRLSIMTQGKLRGKGITTI